MEIEPLVRAALGLMAVVAAVGLAALAYRVIAANPTEYRHIKRRAQSGIHALDGTLPVSFDGTRDFHVAAGMVFDRRERVFKAQGRLSSDALELFTD